MLASEWLKMGPLDTSIPYANTLVDMAVCDSRVLLGGGGTKTLYVFDLSIRRGFCVNATDIYRLACTRLIGDTLVAFSHVELVSATAHLSDYLFPPLCLEQISTSVTSPILAGPRSLLVLNVAMSLVRTQSLRCARRETR